MTLQTDGNRGGAVPTPAPEGRGDERTHKLFLGTFIHSQSLGELRYRHGAAVAVSREGKIVAVEEACDRQRAEAELLPRLGWAVDDVVVVAAKDGQFFFPGFIGRRGKGE